VVNKTPVPVALAKRYPRMATLEFGRGGLVKVADTVKSKTKKPAAIYSEAQAATGQQIFMTNCAMCHGPDLAGVTGPALKGAKFASAKDQISVSDIFGIMSTQMPAGPAR